MLLLAAIGNDGGPDETEAAEARRVAGALLVVDAFAELMAIRKLLTPRE